MGVVGSLVHRASQVAHPAPGRLGNSVGRPATPVAMGKVSLFTIFGRSPSVAPDAHGDPAGSLGGGTTGQGAWEHGLSLRTIAQKLGMARDTVGKYAKAESPPTKKLSARERSKAQALAASLTATD